jgi:hypothetical protein
MALRGVWQLQKLVVNYCDWGGSSRGIRYDSLRSFVPHSGSSTTRPCVLVACRVL